MTETRVARGSMDFYASYVSPRRVNVNPNAVGVHSGKHNHNRAELPLHIHIVREVHCGGCRAEPHLRCPFPEVSLQDRRCKPL